VTGPVTVQAQVLQTHAASVDVAVERLTLSRQAAQATSLDSGAYGQLCQFMVHIFEPSVRVTVDGLIITIDELHRLADALRTGDESFAQAEAQAGDAVLVPEARLRMPL
jgi:hypothetical protein